MTKEEQAKAYADERYPIPATEVGNAQQGYSLAQIEHSICKDDFLAGYEACKRDIDIIVHLEDDNICRSDYPAGFVFKLIEKLGA